MAKDNGRDRCTAISANASYMEGFDTLEAVCFIFGFPTMGEDGIAGVFELGARELLQFVGSCMEQPHADTVAVMVVLDCLRCRCTRQGSCIIPFRG